MGIRKFGPLVSLILLLTLALNPSSPMEESRFKIDLPSGFLKAGGAQPNKALGSGGRARIVLELVDAREEWLRTLVDEGVVLEVKRGNLVQGLAPASKLPKLAELPFVRSVRPPAKAVPFAVESEGVSSIQADLLHLQGVLGEGVRVAVVDLGFDVANPEIQANIAEYRSFRADGDVTGGSLENLRHGTACAEIIVDVAPKAELYLLNFETDVEFLTAVDYAVDAGVDVISFSAGFVNVGPYDGTSYIDQAVDEARARGVLFVVSAGNEALEHWSGKFRDEDGDGFNEFAPADETNELYAQAGSAIKVFLSWDGWPASADDYDLYLLDESFNLVAYSANPQTGFQPPTEGIIYLPPKTGVYRVAIRRVGGGGEAKFHLFSFDHSLEHYVEAGSLTCPAEARGSLTVGAAFFGTNEVESFSSRGPTDDGRIKPDLTGPDGVSTASYGPVNFFGTSASAPHVAGAAALLLSVNPELTPDQLQSILEESAVDLGDPGKDNVYGSGMVNAYGAYSLLGAEKPKRKLEVHAHPVSYQYPSEPPEELEAEISVTYTSDGLSRTESGKPVFSVFADDGTSASLRVERAPPGYVWVEWDEYGTGRSESEEITVFMDEDKTAIAYFKLLEATATLSPSKAVLTVHAHPDAYQYPSEPPEEVEAKILVEYFEGGLAKKTEGAPIFQVSADLGSMANLTVTFIPAGYAWHEWDNYGFGRTGSMNAKVFVDGNKTLIAYFTPTIERGGFSLTVSPPTQFFFPGQTVNYTVKVVPVNGFDSEVALAASNLPPNSTARFEPSSVRPPASAILEVSTSPFTPPSPYKLVITASGGNLTRTAEARLEPAAVPGFGAGAVAAGLGAFIALRATTALFKKRKAFQPKPPPRLKARRA